jgi:membrane-associated phospholipid phosphatase
MTHTALIVLACFIGSATAAPQPQNPAEDATSQDSSSTASGKPERPTSLKLLVPNILHDQKPIWTFPLKVAEGKHWKPLVGITLATVGLVVLDPYGEPYFRNSPGFSAYKTGPLRGRNTTLAVTLTPVAFYLTGLAKHSRHSQNTALLAAEGIADTQLLSLVMKHIDGRLTPSDIPPHGNFRDTWFKYKGTFTNGGSFPSGHAASAFAVATVIANRYRQHRWIPWFSYGAAAFVALTRVPDQAHFPSDVFMGAVLGYTISHFVVLHR